MNYNAVFSFTARAERSIKAHKANLPAYFLIASVIALTAIKNAFDFIAAHIERLPEYRLRINHYSLRFQIAKVRLYRRIVTAVIVMMIRAGETRGLTSVIRLWASATGARIIAVTDKLFCID